MSTLILSPEITILNLRILSSDICVIINMCIFIKKYFIILFYKISFSLTIPMTFFSVTLVLHHYFNGCMIFHCIDISDCLINSFLIDIYVVFTF